MNGLLNESESSGSQTSTCDSSKYGQTVVEKEITAIDPPLAAMAIDEPPDGGWNVSELDAIE